MGYALVNYKQTREERQQKYWLARTHGFNSYEAMRMRDWRLHIIEGAISNLALNDRLIKERGMPPKNEAL